METVAAAHTAGRFNSLAIYINACESGGLFDKDSGATEYLAKHNTVALVAAPKGESSSTFTPSAAMIRYASWSDHSKAGDKFNNLAKPYHGHMATYFGRFWHDGVMRGDPLSTSIRDEHANMRARGRPFLSWKKETRRDRRGFARAAVYDFNPQLHGPEGTNGIGRMSGDFTVAPFWRSWNRDIFDALTEVKYRVCVNTVATKWYRGANKKVDEADLKKARSDALMARVYAPLLTRVYAHFDAEVEKVKGDAAKVKAVTDKVKALQTIFDDDSEKAPAKRDSALQKILTASDGRIALTDAELKWARAIKKIQGGDDKKRFTDFVNYGESRVEGVAHCGCRALRVSRVAGVARCGCRALRVSRDAGGIDL